MHLAYVAVLLLLACAAPARAQARYTEPAFWSRPSSQAPSHLGSRAPVPADTTRPARPRDRWLGFDKVQHVTFSFLWTLGGQYTLVNKLELSEEEAVPFSAATAAGAGLAKEIYDRRAGPTRYFSTKDLAADAAGILLALGLIAL